MAYVVQQSDLYTLQQPERNTYSKIELLDHNFKVTGRIDGEMVSDSYAFDADSDIRKTYQLTLIVKDSTFLVGQDRKIWLDKYLRIYTGIFSLREKQIKWYPMGLFLLDVASYSFNPVTKELSLSCSDRMIELTGQRNGKVSGYSVKIPADSLIEEAMRSTVTQLGGVQECRITGITETVPYDLEFGVGTNVWAIICELRDLYVGYETFFDDQLFVCRPYPTFISDPVALSAQIVSTLVISENTAVSFPDIKNVTEVWGKCYEADYYTNDVTYSGGTYSTNYSGSPVLASGQVFGFLATDDNLANPKFKVNENEELPILGENNTPIEAGKILAGSSYVLKYRVVGTEKYFYFCGNYQICGVSKLVLREPSAEEKATQLLNEPTTNVSWVVRPDSPFCVDIEGIGEIREVLSGGEFENIYSDELAIQRAEYETWITTDMKDTLTLEMIEVPWLDVNQKIEYRPQATGVTEQYIVKQKNGSTTGGTMTITCVKFQPLYPWNE